MDHPSKPILLQHKEELQQRLAGVERDLAAPHSADSAEQAVERENDDVLQSLKAEAEHELELIAGALRRIDAGTYGVCTLCGVDIQEKRLLAMPWAARCIDCADKT